MAQSSDLEQLKMSVELPGEGKSGEPSDQEWETERKIHAWLTYVKEGRQIPCDELKNWGYREGDQFAGVGDVACCRAVRDGMLLVCNLSNVACWQQQHNTV